MDNFEGLQHLGIWSAVAVVLRVLIKDTFRYLRTRKERKNGGDLKQKIADLEKDSILHTSDIQEIQENVKEIKTDVKEIKAKIEDL